MNSLAVVVSDIKDYRVMPWMPKSKGKIVSGHGVILDGKYIVTVRIPLGIGKTFAYINDRVISENILMSLQPLSIAYHDPRFNIVLMKMEGKKTKTSKSLIFNTSSSDTLIPYQSKKIIVPKKGTYSMTYYVSSVREGNEYITKETIDVIFVDTFHEKSKKAFIFLNDIYLHRFKCDCTINGPVTGAVITNGIDIIGISMTIIKNIIHVIPYKYIVKTMTRFLSGITGPMTIPVDILLLENIPVVHSDTTMITFDNKEVILKKNDVVTEIDKKKPKIIDDVICITDNDIGVNMVLNDYIRLNICMSMSIKTANTKRIETRSIADPCYPISLNRFNDSITMPFVIFHDMIVVSLTLDTIVLFTLHNIKIEHPLITSIYELNKPHPLFCIVDSNPECKYPVESIGKTRPYIIKGLIINKINGSEIVSFDDFNKHKSITSLIVNRGKKTFDLANAK